MPTALLIIDIQHALCSGNDAVFDADKVIARVNRLSHQARAAGLPVFVVRHESDRGEFSRGSEGWQLAAGLIVEKGDVLVAKKGSDAFHHTELQSLLQTRGITDLVICGMQTQFCVESTVRRALALGYPVTLAEDGHTTTDTPVLTAPQIIAHHNQTLSDLSAYGVRATLKRAENIAF